jgi:hypothetical protein
MSGGVWSLQYELLVVSATAIATAIATAYRSRTMP